MVGGQKVKDPASQELEGSSEWMVKYQELRCVLEKVTASWGLIQGRRVRAKTSFRTCLELST